MALRPDSAGSHYLKGRIERLRGDCVNAARGFERALEIDPNHAGAITFLVSTYAMQIGRPSAADALSERLAALDPLSPLVMFVVGWHEWMSGRLGEALSTFEKVLGLDPDWL